MLKKSQVLRSGDLEVDLGARRVTRDGDEIQLGCLSFDLLEALVQAAPSAVSNEEIVEAVWDGDIVTDETIKQRVSLLRRGLGEAPEGQYVETLRGFGYRLGVPVAFTEAPAQPAAGPSTRPGGLGRGLVLVLAIVSLILVIAVLATALRQVKRMSDRRDEPTAQQTVAVDNGLSGSPQQRNVGWR